jgi:hypothetical protein
MQSDQNPFVRLKRFTLAGNDPKENHATEVLAACLDLSLQLRTMFLKLTGEAESTLSDASAWTIRTQVPIEAASDEAERSIIDLLLENTEANRAVLIEVKVGDRARQRQFRKYLDVLERGNPSIRGTLSALVRNPSNVDPELYNQSANSSPVKIITWAKVANGAEGLLNSNNVTHQTTDQRIAKRLINYLQSEGISMNHKTDDLFGYAKGILAEEALAALLEHCRSEAMRKLSLRNDSITTTNRAKAFPRLTYFFESGYFNVDVHLRAKGLEDWSGGHALALGITVHSKLPKADAAQLAREFHASGWQVWHQIHAQGAIPQPWTAAQKASDIPPEIHGVYLYRPLFGEADQPSDHATIPEPSSTDWDALLSLVTERFVEAIQKLRDFEARLPGNTAATSPAQDSAGASNRNQRVQKTNLEETDPKPE